MNEISIAMIVKDEEKILENTLKALKDNEFNDIVIVDTGSTDKTMEIAKKYTNKVYDYKWDNDFSRARNYSLTKTDNDLVLIVDADEVVENINKDELLSIIKSNKNMVGRIEIINTYVKNGNEFNYSEYVSRLFDRNLYEFKGKIHEQIVSKDSNRGYNTYIIPVKVIHEGYNKEEVIRKDKINRNITLLKEMLKEDDKDTYVLYQLGKTYFMQGDYKEAIKYFTKALDFDLDVRLEYVQDMVESYGYALLNNEEYEKALDLTGVYEEFKCSCDFVFLIGNIYMNNGYYNEAIEEFKKATRYSTCKMKGINDYLANYNIGVIYECIGNIDEAIKYYKKSSEYKNSKERLKVLGVK